MGKRKKKVTNRKTSASKKTKSEEEQPSTSKEEESAPVSDDVVLPVAEEKAPPSDELIPTENVTEDLPSIEPDGIVSLSEEIITNDEDLAPGSPGEFVFAPIVSRSGEGSSTVNLCGRTSPEDNTPSTSATDKVVSLLTSIVGGQAKKQTGGDSSSGTNVSSRTTSAIEIIDVDELPDTPCSSIGDDVIEITPSNSNRSSRSNSPEIIMNRHVVDLTRSVERVEHRISDSVDGTEEDADDEGDVFLSLWSAMHQEKRKAKTTPTLVSSNTSTETKTTNSADEAESSSCSKLHCPICMDDFSQIAKDRRLMSTSCGHVFCDVCVKAAVETQKRCPTCRKKQTMKNLHPIFL